METTDVIFLFQDSQGISSNTVGNIKTVLKKMMPKLGDVSSDFNFAVAKYATSRQMSCFGSADETISYMDNEYQHGGSGLNLLNLALSKMVLKQFEKRPDDRKENAAKVSYTFGYCRFCSDCVMSKFKLSALSLTFIKIDVKNIENFGENAIKTKGPFPQGSKMFLLPKSYKEYLKPYDDRAVLYTYS